MDAASHTKERNWVLMPALSALLPMLTVQSMFISMSNECLKHRKHPPHPHPPSPAALGCKMTRVPREKAKAPREKVLPERKSFNKVPRQKALQKHQEKRLYQSTKRNGFTRVPREKVFPRETALPEYKEKKCLYQGTKRKGFTRAPGEKALPEKKKRLYQREKAFPDQKGFTTVPGEKALPEYQEKRLYQSTKRRKGSTRVPRKKALAEQQEKNPTACLKFCIAYQWDIWLPRATISPHPFNIGHKFTWSEHAGSNRLSYWMTLLSFWV